MKTLTEWMFLSLLTVGLGLFAVDLVADAIDGQITMQLEQVEKTLNDH